MCPVGDSFCCFSPSCSEFLLPEEESSRPGFMPFHSGVCCSLSGSTTREASALSRLVLFLFFQHPLESGGRSLQVAINLRSVNGSGSLLTY